MHTCNLWRHYTEIQAALELPDEMYFLASNHKLTNAPTRAILKPETLSSKISFKNFLDRGKIKLNKHRRT